MPVSKLRIGASALVFTLASAVAAQAQVEKRPPITPYKPAFAGQTRAPEEKLGVAFDTTVVAQGLKFPWSLAFLPDGRMLVTERILGNLRIVGKDGTLSDPVAGVPAVMSKGQGGLLDVVLDPAFKTNRLIYLSYAEPQADGTNNTAVARASWWRARAAHRRADGDLPPDAVAGVEPALRLAAGVRPRRQALRHAGRTLDPGGPEAGPGSGQPAGQDRADQSRRLGPEGQPLRRQGGARPEIWTYGNRNVQAAALNPQTGELWEVEYGPQGGDEINVARKGKNYGWATITYGVNYGPAKTPITGGETQRPGMEQPLYYWDPVIAPSGMIFYTGALFPKWKGSLFISGKQPQGLPGGDITRLTIRNEKAVGEERLAMPNVANWRDIRQGPDGAIYLLQDGPVGKIVKLTPK